MANLTVTKTGPHLVKRSDKKTAILMGYYLAKRLDQSLAMHLVVS